MQTPSMTCDALLMMVGNDCIQANIKYKCYRIRMRQSDNPEKLATQGTQDEEKQDKDTT